MPDKITSRFGLSEMFSVLFFTGFIGFLGGLALYSLILTVASGNVAIAGSLLLILYIGLAIVAIRYFLRRNPQVTIDRRGIWYRALFARAGFFWEDVAKINLLETRIHQFEESEATSFELKDGKKFVIWVDAYQNDAELRQVIEQARSLLQTGESVGQGLQFEPKFNDIAVDLDTDEGKVFASNHFLSFRGIAFYAMNFMAVFSLITDSENGWGDFLFWHLLSWALGYDLFYFEITKNNLIARHHLFFWYEKIIPLCEIRQCAFYQKFRRAQSLRVILKDFRRFNFTAGSLSEKNWIEFRKTLKKQNIALR